MRRLLFTAALIVLAAPAYAADKPLTIDKASTIETGSALPTANVFMFINNPGKKDDTLLGASTPLTENVTITITEMGKDGKLTTNTLKSVEIPAGKTVVFTPLSENIYLSGTNKQMKAGETFPLTLEFAKAGKRDVTVQVISGAELVNRFPATLMADNTKKIDAALAAEKAKTEVTGKSFMEKLMEFGKRKVELPQGPAPTPTQMPAQAPAQ